MKSPAELEASVERFRTCFWHKRAAGRPPVGIAPDRAWLPLQYLREPFLRAELLPGDISGALARTDYEDAAPRRAIHTDDWIPYSAAWRAVPWLEAICGCVVRYAAGSLAPHRFLDSAAAAFPPRRDWLEVLYRETAALVRDTPAACWVSTSIFRGASDVLAAMRGLENFMLDLYDDPGPVAAAAHRIASLHAEVLERHFALVPPKLGGYGHIFGYWAPGPTTVLQEDALGLCAPDVFERLFLEPNAAMVERLGDHVLFHLHSTGYRHWRQVLQIPRLAGLELTVEVNGPSLEAMTPHLREILERSRLILYIDGWFEQLADTLRRLPREGLYLVVSDKFVRSEAEFRSLLRSL